LFIDRGKKGTTRYSSWLYYCEEGRVTTRKGSKIKLKKEYYSTSTMRPGSAGITGTIEGCFCPAFSPTHVNLNLCMSVASTILVSNRAKYCPRQFLGPSMKGMKVKGAGVE